MKQNKQYNSIFMESYLSKWHNSFFSIDTHILFVNILALKWRRLFIKQKKEPGINRYSSIIAIKRIMTNHKNHFESNILWQQNRNEVFP